ncbi:hypothetical protein PACTADRAFT_46491 [Pachysolen tannophilus NRRL Y-2460]|uniref:Histone deacetylase n=1 Tax=Pachysolen tannophilus NRRL Y-2460 TaxID=669874 RepID=A0A1E4TP92_PACTA|nr:hypothetical protein PACTADRAFT_46491 [Pachysolen tannophilus NRRL Y-2460]
MKDENSAVNDEKETLNGIKRKIVESNYNGDTTELNEKQIIVPICSPKLFYIPKKTGLCYDVRMRYHAKIYTSYYEYIDPHPEDPRRIYRIYKILAENGLINDPQLIGRNEIGDLMLKIPVREATEEEILLVHSEEHLKFIESTTLMNKQQLLEATEKGDSVYFNHDSFLGAKLSCGGAIEACKSVVEGKVKNALAVVRPPGHHAEPDVPGGFCLFSNVAVAAKNILKNYPESVRKIVIVDWDVHHGNGTQKAFINDPRVLYISLHRYEQGKYYPGTTAGSADQCGEAEGEGYNINIPWASGGKDDADYMYAFRRVIMPICYEFNPDLVIISSGFDAADGDVIGGCHVSPAGYGHMTHQLKSLAKGNLCVVLEGGYNLDSIAKSALSVAKILVGEPPEELWKKIAKPETIETIEKVIKIQSKYWRSMKPEYGGLSTPRYISQVTSDSTDKELVDNFNYRLHDSIRLQQSKELFKLYDFINLPILLSTKLESVSLENAVLASPSIYEAQTLIILVHDPAQVWAQRDPVSGILDSSNSIVIDSCLRFIEWALKQKYGLIDVNIPTSITGSDDDNYNNINTSQEILLYIWDNYIQYFQVSKLVFIGVGDSYNGIIHLLGHREVKNLVKASINFIDKTTQLRPIVSAIDESITDWFYKNSLIFTSNKHECWGSSAVDDEFINHPDVDEGVSLHPNGDANMNSISNTHSNHASGYNGGKRPRKKYGRVLKSDSDGLENIVDESDGDSDLTDI